MAGYKINGLTRVTAGKIQGGSREQQLVAEVTRARLLAQFAAAALSAMSNSIGGETEAIVNRAFDIAETMIDKHLLCIDSRLCAIQED